VAGRTAASRLHLIGWDDLIYDDDDAFVSTAVALTGDRERLAADLPRLEVFLPEGGVFLRNLVPGT
jgi:predicted O-linked N-acetylglucosamine transferase (SPINDLY family)